MCNTFFETDNTVGLIVLRGIRVMHSELSVGKPCINFDVYYMCRLLYVVCTTSAPERYTPVALIVFNIFSYCAGVYVCPVYTCTCITGVLSPVHSCLWPRYFMIKI